VKTLRNRPTRSIRCCGTAKRAVAQTIVYRRLRGLSVKLE
jgi:hypothetical protein